MSNIDKDIERCKELIKTEHSNWIGMSNQDAISNVLSELEKKDNIIFETKKYLENMTKSSIRDKDGYYLGNWYVLQPYELEKIIDILKGNYNDEQYR